MYIVQVKKSTAGNEEVDMRPAQGLHVKFFKEEDVDQPCRKESAEVGNSFIPVLSLKGTRKMT